MVLAIEPSILVGGLSPDVGVSLHASGVKAVAFGNWDVGVFVECLSSVNAFALVRPASLLAAFLKSFPKALDDTGRQLAVTLVGLRWDVGVFVECPSSVNAFALVRPASL